MKKRDYKYIFYLLLIVAFICSCCFLPYIITDTPLTYGTDIKPQWFLFYEEFRNLITNFIETGTFPFYSWTMFLGNNFFASKSYYLMGDIFSYFGLLFNMQFFNMALLIEIIKFFVAASTMFMFLKEIGISKKTCILGAVCYTFSSWAIFFSGQLSFLSFYCWMPLYFLGIERYLRNNKKAVYILSAVLLLFTNFYFFYTISLLSPFYFGYRFYLLNGNFKSFWKSAGKLIIYYLIGVMITGILTFPTIHYILDNDRIGGIQYFFAFDQIKIYLHELVAMFVPNYLYIYKSNVFETGWHVTRELCMWAGTIISLLCLQIFTYKDKIFKKATLIFYAFLILILLFPIMNSVIHGFSDPSFRWTIFFIFFNIIVGCTIFDNFNLISKKWVKKSGILFCIILILIVPFTAFLSGDIIGQYTGQIVLFSSFGFLILIYSRLLNKNNIDIKLIIILTVIEIALSSSLLYLGKRTENDTNNFEFINQVTHVLEYNENELTNYLDNIEPVNSSQYYRVFVPHEELYWSYSHNMSLIYNLNGLMTYDSTYAPSFNRMKKFAPEVKDFESEWIFNIKNGSLVTFLNTKYALVLDESQLPSDCNWRLIADDYNGFISVYRNDDYRELGKSYSKSMTFNEFFADGSQSEKLLNYVVSDEEINQYLGNDEAVLENIRYSGNQLTGNVNSKDNTFMVITIPYDKGWKILVNGVETEYYDVNGGFIGIPIQQGDTNIEMYFIPQGFKQGGISSITGIIIFVVLMFFEMRGKSNDKKNKG